ncbi:MAG TPA: dienelactone hydrolase family protein [Sphingomicrobium sp.]|jgi:carboxymethylenebutenolidase|nr:dienelactone hydrolase family protein [Sphingomicrobium sp.]
MCGDGNHQGFIADTSVTRRAILLSLGAVAAAGGVPMAAFAEDAGARPVTEKDVLVKTADGSSDGALFYPRGKGKWPAVLLWPDILGLRPVFREMGRRLAAQGYVVLVPNPYYRAKKAPVVEGPFDFSNKDDMNKLMAFRNGLTDPMVDRDSAAYVTFLDSQPQTDKRRKAGVQGYCMSGPIAFRTAAARPDRIGAVATFHPGALVTDKPSSPHLLIPRSRAAYLVIIAKNDAEKMPREKPDLDAAFSAARKTAKVEISSANHGWTVAGSQTYDEKEAERAWAELLPFYRANLR